MIKAEKQKKFKREYIPVIIAAIILVALVAVLIVAIFFEDNTEYDEVTPTYSDTSDLAIDKTNSKCTSGELDELINIAKKVTVEYESGEKIVEEPDGELWEDDGIEGEETEIVTNIIVKNLTEEIYIIVKNNYNDKEQKYTYQDSNNGTLTFEGETVEEKVTYSIEVYSNKYECINEIIRNISLETKIFNIYSTLLFCTQYPKYDKCVEYVDEEFTFNEFYEGSADYTTGKEEEAEMNLAAAQVQSAGKNPEELTKETKTLMDRINDNREFIIISVIIIFAGVAIVILLAILRRN